jgi:hypothetical protein
MQLNSTDQTYLQARALLLANPELGKKKLAIALGVHPPMGRIFKQRFMGETEGHATDAQYKAVRVLKQKHPDWSTAKIAEALVLSVDKTRVHLARYQGATAPLPVNLASTGSAPEAAEEIEEPIAGAEVKIAGSADAQSISSRSSRIRSVEDLLLATQTDTSTVWEVERHVINKWSVGARNPVTGEILTEDLFQVKAWLRRRVAEQRLETLFQQLLEKFKAAAPVRPALPRPPGRKGMLEVSLMDLHLGKYCWSPETGGRAYEPAETERIFWVALEDLLQKSSACPAEKILFVVGNDFFNVDNANNTTHAGTEQSEHGNFSENFILGRDLMIKAIDRLTQVAPVHVLIVPGNHDTTRLWYLGSTLQSWYRNTADVKVDHTCTPRKYILYGKNLIGFCHGNLERHEKLPILMATERPGEWAASAEGSRHWHVGHFHSKKTKVFVAHEDLQAVQVRVLPSLCPPDAWHASMGYSGKLAAEAYWWDPIAGCVATFTHNAT